MQSKSNAGKLITARLQKSTLILRKFKKSVKLEYLERHGLIGITKKWKGFVILGFLQEKRKRAVKCI